MAIGVRKSFPVPVAKRALLLCSLIAVILSTATGNACDVPVHRYILQRWEREDYQAYYFYRSEENRADREVNQFLEDAASSFGSHVNLAFRVADVEKPAANPFFAEDQKVWDEHRIEKLPSHLVLSPRGMPLFLGRLDLASARAMIQSPLRTGIARELSGGKGGLLLLLTGDNKAKNSSAEKDIRWVLERAKKQHGLDVGFLHVSRSDPAEEWLVRFLMGAVDSQIAPDQCAIFGICGRGRVLTAHVGQETTRRNIVESVRIMNGDCSCDLRAESPGMDLLMDWDWEAAIANLPPVTEPPLRSALLGFDDSEEAPSGTLSNPGESQERSAPASHLRTRTLTLCLAAFGLASVVMIALSLLVMKRRKEV